MPNVNSSCGLVAALGLGMVVLAGCATTATTQSDCYPHIFLDSRYAIQGTSRESAATLRDSSCYYFVHQGGRIVRVDHRRGGALTPDPTSGVATIRIEQPEGFEKRVFLDASGRPTANYDGAYAVALKYDDKNNPVEWKNLGADDRLKEAKDSGLAIFRWRYDPQGQPIEEKHFGANEQLKADRRLGVAIVRWQYDPDGNTVEESYLGADGRPTSDKNRGVAIVRWQYDANRNTVEERYLGTDQRLKTDRRLGVAIIRWQYDSYGREIGTLMLDPNEVP